MALPSNPALNVLDVELAGEQALTLGRLAKAAETALAALAAEPARTGEGYERLLQAASAAVWRYFVQREICGALDHRDAIALYAIPQDVLNRLGSVR